MKALLSLRQHKIIQLLRDRKTYVTSDEIAKVLNVSSRTVRTDIADINSVLEAEGILIDSIKSKGFILRTEDPDLLKEFSKDNLIFMDRSDRVFYLAVKLCTTCDPLDLYDLEDEMAVSSSTLAGDITAFKNRFVYSAPYIEFKAAKSTICLERNEQKRRFILTNLLSNNWDYNSTLNIYYESDFIDPDSFRIINSTTAGILLRHGIFLDDYHLISLNLYLSVMYHRLTEGLMLDMEYTDAPQPKNIQNACRELFALLGEKLDYDFPEEEIIETGYIIISFYNMSLSHFDESMFPAQYHEIAHEYINSVRDTFGLDLSDNEKFYHRLVVFVSQLFNPMKDMSVRDTPEHIKQHLFAEFAVASLFYTVNSGKCRLVEEDLLYLTWAISAAFYSHYEDHPENRFNTVILCHMSINAAWSLKIAVQNLYGGYLNIQDIIPVYQKDYYDFSGTKLVLSTINKKISLPGNTDVLDITPYFSKENSHAVSDRIRRLKIEALYPENVITINELLENAYVHEKQLFSSQFNLIEYMCQDFIDDGIFTQEHLLNMTSLESIASFAYNPAVLLLYSNIPASETRLSVLTLDHRIMWNKYKIRIVFMISLAKEDMRELFYLQEMIFHRHSDPEVMKHFKTIEEIREYYGKCEE